MLNKTKSYFIFLLIAFSFLFSFSLSAQNIQQAKIDSLVEKLSQAKEDSNKVKLFEVILFHHQYYKCEEGLKYEKPALELAEKLKWKIGVARIKNMSGRIYWRLGKFDEALKRHFDALLLYTEANDQESLAQCLTNLGQDYADGGKYSQALIFFKKALKKYKATGNKKQMTIVLMLLAL